MAQRRRLDNGKPELNDGYLKIANELVSQFVKLKITAAQWNILFLVMRETYGYNRKSKGLAVSYVAKAIGVSEFRTGKAIQELIRRNILIEYSESTPRASREIGINKYYLEWDRDNADVTSDPTGARGHADVTSDPTPALGLDPTGALPKQRQIKDTLKDNSPSGGKIDWDAVFAD